ncbi:MAG: hypothetical protein KA310_03615 [Pseudomonadales bacterium]|nr:hypothetical protein [Pseudomonadales bacterium]
MTDPSSYVFGRQVEARRYVEAVAARMLTVELAQFEETDEGWFFGGVTHEPTRRRIRKAVRALAAKLEKAAKR